MDEQGSLVIEKNTPDDKPKIDLNSVEEVKLPNGHRYIKYIDLEKDIPVMLMINEASKTTKEIIDGLQIGSFSYSASDVMGSERNFKNQEILIIPIEKIDNYQYAFNNMNTEQRQIVNLYIKNKDSFNPHLRYINVDEGIAIDDLGKVITCMFNPQTNRYDVKYSDVVKYEKENVTKENDTLDSFDLEAILVDIVENNKTINVEGCTISKALIEEYAKNIGLENNNIEEKIKNRFKNTNSLLKIINELSIIYKDKYGTDFQSGNNSLSNAKVKVKVPSGTARFGGNQPAEYSFNPNINNMGYASQILTVSLATFAIGVIFGILIFALKLFS